MTPKLRANHAVGQSITVSTRDVDLFTYTYQPDTPLLESPKPYLSPIRTLTGDVVSLFRPHDHVWHKGIAWSLPNVGEHNFWGGPTYVPGHAYVQLENNGSAVHRDLTALSVTDDQAVVAHRLDWHSQAGAPVIEEHRSLTTTIVDDDAWALVFDTTMTNVSGSTLSIGSPTTKGRENAGYGGLFWRGPRSFTGGIVRSPSGTGGDDLRGTRAPWFGFSGQHDQTARWSTIVMVDDTTNPNHPPQWFVRTAEFACLCPAPFFSEELDVATGSTIRFRYAVVVAAGNHDNEGTAALAAHGTLALAAAGDPGQHGAGQNGASQHSTGQHRATVA